MRGIKRKTLVPLLAMLALFIAFAVSQVVIVSRNIAIVRNMEEHYLATEQKMNQLKLNVVEVQQWLSDISATRAQGGYNDGLNKASENADQARKLIADLKQSLTDKNMLATTDLIASSFEEYYSNGVTMANAYINSGTDAGNAMMGSFDKSADTINKNVDSLLESINAVVSQEEARVTASIGQAYILIAAFMALAVLVIIWSVRRVRKSIVRPIEELNAIADGLASGDLQQEIHFRSNDELGNLADDMRAMCQTLQSNIGDISRSMRQLSEGNLTIALEAEYKGDFILLKKNTETFLAALNDAFQKIHQASNEVSSESEQLANASEELSNGATEQASSIEELSATVQQISGDINKNAEDAQEVGRLSVETREGIRESNDCMTQMVEAMNDISATTEQIGKIIKTIEDIAFQTNILALNAAVEAARAGESGQGFAVVADEVRSLAQHSSEASQQTAAMIENAFRAVESGRKVVGIAAERLQDVVGKTVLVNDRIQAIAAASEQQAQAVTQVTMGLEQISGVVQTNSATAEETAASTEQLSAQSQILKDLIDQFRLREASLPGKE